MANGKGWSLIQPGWIGELAGLASNHRQSPLCGFDSYKLKLSTVYIAQMVLFEE